MRILFDGQQLSERMTGVGYYSDRIVRALLGLDRRNEWLVLCHNQNADYVRGIVTGRSNAQMVVLNQPVSLDYRVQQGMLSELIPSREVDLYFSPSFLSVPRKLCPSVSVIHDVTYALFPEFQPQGVAEYLHRCVTDTCGNAWRLIAVSENSRKDIASMYHVSADRISVVSEAADEAFFRPYSGEEISIARTKHRLPCRYILAVNMGNPKKNAPILAGAYAKLPSSVRADVKLVVVGEWSPDALDLRRVAENAGCGADVILTGHIPREDLYRITAGASLFCFPSLHEGFGLPVLEAMAAGIPVISSEAASLPEVAGDAAVLLDPKNVGAWTAAMERLLISETDRAELSARGKKRAREFSWVKAARETLAVLEQAPCTSKQPIPIASSPAPRFEPVATSGFTCTISVDDVRPAPGFGGERERGPLCFLLRLYEEFGCKSTLFVPTNWQGQWPVSQHLDWLGWLRDQPCFEIACHGDLHATAVGNSDPGEFRGLTPDALEEVIGRSLEVFVKIGYRPSGVKAPGWLMEPSAYGVFVRWFDYVADHVQGTELSRLEGQSLVRVPYLYTIDELGVWPESGSVVLQSHAAPEGRTTNGWTEPVYERVRAFIRTGVRLGVEFATIAEVRKAVAFTRPLPAASSTTVRAVELDSRLRGGETKVLGEEAGVLYNASGASCPVELRADNATVAILSRNRRQYLSDLLRNIDETGPKELGRVVVLNNSEDDSAELVRKQFPHWRVADLRDDSYPEEPPGLVWLKKNRPELLPKPLEKVGPPSGWTAPRSIGWLRNRLLLECEREFVVEFDDDFAVKPGWWEYYVRFQREYGAHAVMNNFGAFVMALTVPRQIGWIDERFLGSHGCEDNDYAARISEARVRWVLGFNRDHDWRSAEQGNPRGSMTGADYFVHRYALLSGGYSARRDEAARDPIRASWNQVWFVAKWEETREDTGVFSRPPFRGAFLRRKVQEEPDWHSLHRPGTRVPARTVT